jgi:hypothetical protein
LEVAVSEKELWQMIETLTQYVDDLKKLHEVQQRKIAELNNENAGWLKIYQKLQIELAALKAKQSQH